MNKKDKAIFQEQKERIEALESELRQTQAAFEASENELEATKDVLREAERKLTARAGVPQPSVYREALRETIAATTNLTQTIDRLHPTVVLQTLQSITANAFKVVS
jgi:hypothetical protein